MTVPNRRRAGQPWFGLFSLLSALERAKSPAGEGVVLEHLPVPDAGVRVDGGVAAVDGPAEDLSLLGHHTVLARADGLTTLPALNELIGVALSTPTVVLDLGRNFHHLAEEVEAPGGRASVATAVLPRFPIERNHKTFHLAHGVSFVDVARLLD